MDGISFNEHVLALVDAHCAHRACREPYAADFDAFYKYLIIMNE